MNLLLLACLKCANSGGDSFASPSSHPHRVALRIREINSTEFEVVKALNDDQVADGRHHTTNKLNRKPKGNKNFRLEQSGAEIRKSIFKRIANLRRQMKMKNEKI